VHVLERDGQGWVRTVSALEWGERGFVPGPGWARLGGLLEVREP
jgi:pilus assembly protein CpaF